MPRPILHVLQIEDNMVDIDLFKRALKKTGIHIRHHVVQDGEEALNFLFRRNGHTGIERPDLILLDLNIPRTDGREVLLAIKGDPRLKLIPVIILTNSRLDVDVTYCYEQGAACYLIKSADIMEFTAQMKKLFDFWSSVELAPPEAS